MRTIMIWGFVVSMGCWWAAQAALPQAPPAPKPPPQAPPAPKTPPQAPPASKAAPADVVVSAEAWTIHREA
ncbi:MAG: hypothetical protein RMJ56_00355, partial [Gemmataceae bacterium]|nr:hypothetical protein [Gemmata sp.]MDW8196031.1 hypothetical protein [Gemmataceae bacterium]